MDTQVDEGAAGGILLMGEPAAGAAVTAEIGGLGVIEIAEEILVPQLFDELAVPAVPADKADLQKFPGTLCGFQHLLRRSSGIGHGLFAEDIFPGFQRQNGAGSVLVVPGADADGIQLRQSLQHFRFIGVKAGDAEAGAFFFQTLFVDVTEGVQLYVGICLVGFDMAFCNVSDADDGNFDFFHGWFLLISFAPAGSLRPYGCPLPDRLRSPAQW